MAYDELTYDPEPGSVGNVVGYGATEEAAVVDFKDAQLAQLGRYSDHEGDENGSTWHFWQQGISHFDMYAARAIVDHKAAINVWEQLRELNKARRAAPPPAEQKGK